MRELSGANNLGIIPSIKYVNIRYLMEWCVADAAMIDPAMPVGQRAREPDDPPWDQSMPHAFPATTLTSGESLLRNGSVRQRGDARSAAALSKHLAQSLCPVPSVSRRILCPDCPAAGKRHNDSTLGPYPAIGGFSPRWPSFMGHRVALPGSSSVASDYQEQCAPLARKFSDHHRLSASVILSAGLFVMIRPKNIE